MNSGIENMRMQLFCPFLCGEQEGCKCLFKMKKKNKKKQVIILKNTEPTSFLNQFLLLRASNLYKSSNT